MALWSKFVALFPLKLYKISRFFFFVIAGLQAILLSQYVVDHEKNLGYYGLAALFAVPLVYWFGTLYNDGLKYCLSVVWFLYMLVLVIMIGVIFGQMVVEDNKLKEHDLATCLYNENYYNGNATLKKLHQSDSFFDSKFLKITLCFTPGEMLLLLTSVTDETETLKELYFTTVLDLFDGVEMLEVLHEDVCDKIPMGWRIAVLVASCLFFLLSSLEVHQVKFKKQNNEMKFRKKTVEVNTVFQIVLNLAFLAIRSVLWHCYDFNSAIFLAKNIIGFLIAFVPVLEQCGAITTKSDEETQELPREMGRSNYH